VLAAVAVPVPYGLATMARPYVARTHSSSKKFPPNGGIWQESEQPLPLEREGLYGDGNEETWIHLTLTRLMRSEASNYHCPSFTSIPVKQVQIVQSHLGIILRQNDQFKLIWEGLENLWLIEHIPHHLGTQRQVSLHDI
jgi:hypothetical protein